MKNLFFTLTFVLIGALGFANNSVKKEITTNKELVNELTNSLKTTNKLEIFGTCYIRITFYDENGNVLKTRALIFENVASAEDCSNMADEIETALNN